MTVLLPALPAFRGPRCFWPRLLFASLAASLPIAADGSEPAAADGPVAVLRDGQRTASRLVAVDIERRAELATADGARMVSLDDLAKWGALVEPTRGRLVYWRDGGVLAAESVSIVGNRLTVGSAVFGDISLPLPALAGIAFEPAPRPRDGDSLANRLWQTDENGPGGSAIVQRKTDELWMENGDELSGTIVEFAGSRVVFRTAAGDVNVETDRLVAMVFGPTPGPTIRRGTWLGFRDGTRLLADTFSLDERAVNLARGDEFALSASRDELAFIQPMSPGATFPGELAPSSYRHVPFLSLAWPLRVDRSVGGALLRAGGQLHLKGLGMHSASRVTYRLDKRYRRFVAELAIDDETGGMGSAIFRVFADNVQKFKSEVIRGGEAPTPISVDISGASQISLLVEYADRGDEQDHADWLDARLEE